MPNMPAFCGSCGLVFDSGFQIENSTNIRLHSVSSICPRCGGIGGVPDGIYNVLGGVVQLLSGPRSSAQQIAKLQQALEAARERNQTPEEVRKAVVAVAPELASLASSLPTSRVELYAFITVLLALLSLLVTAYAAWKPSGPSQSEIDTMIKKALDQSASTTAPPSAQPHEKRVSAKIGRNTLCTCGSGKKYKRCCLGAEASQEAPSK